MAQVLFIDDTAELHTIVKESLEPDHQVTCTSTLSQARELLKTGKWELVLVDIGLGDGTGFDLAKELGTTIPLIFLTGHSAIEDKLKAFALGAQDYVTKPFDSRELRARVNARINAKTKAAEKFQNKTFKIEVPLQRAYLLNSEGEIALNLTPIEFKLLYYFCANENRIINREEILGVVWGKNVNVLQRTIDKHISSLRQKLGPVSQQIETIPQVGYRYTS